MLMLLAAAQVYRLVVAVLDVETDGVFVERAALVEVDDIKHGVAAADDVEGGIEDMCRNGHVVSSDSLSFRGGPQDRTSDAQLRIGESRGSGFDVSHRPGTTVMG
jgi:hypothetical protein